MVSSVNSHTDATRIGWHLREIGSRFAPGLSPGWRLGALPARGRDDNPSFANLLSDALGSGGGGDQTILAFLILALQGFLAHQKKLPPLGPP